MGTRILLADDSVTIQKVVELTFMDEDYEVTAVSNGDDALAHLESVQPALVIADVHMPGAGGYDVCRQVKQWRPGTPVLLLVGTFEPFQEDEANRAGADGFLKKPFDSQELLRRVETLLAAAAAAPAVSPVTAPADEGDLWQASDDDVEHGGGDVYGGPAVAAEEPIGPLGGVTAIPDELVIERDPWEAAPAPVAAPTPERDITVEKTTRMEAMPNPFASAPAPAPAPVAPAPVAVAAPVVPAPVGGDGGTLSDADVDRIARRVVQMMGDQLVREVAWDVIPDMAELVIKDRIRELERQLEGQ